MSNNSINDHLKCPITLDLLNDPIIVPCCTKAFSRLSLTQHLENKKICPMCNGDLQDFDPINAPKNVIIAGLIESLQEKPPNKAITNIWSSKITPILDNSGNNLYISNMKIAE